MGKKAPAMTMAELNKKFGGDPTANMLPTSSTGRDFQKGGKGGGKSFRDVDDSRAELNEWRGGGKGGDGFRSGKGSRVGDGESRSDTGNWLDKSDRPTGGGFGGGDRGPRGDRDDRGGGRRGGGDREETAADKSDDWRGGGGPRDPPSRRATTGFGGDGGGERPRLNLKPRTIPEGGEETPKGGDEWETVKKPSVTPGKYVPPSVRKQLEEEEARQKRADDSRPSKESQDRRAPPERAQTATLSSSSGGYVPPHIKKQREKEEQEEKERKRKEREREEEEQREEEEARQREARKKEKEEQAKAEKKAKKQAEKDAAKENSKAATTTQRPAKGKENQKVNGAAGVSDEKLNDFGEECKKLVQGSAAPKVDNFLDMLGDAEFRTIQPISRLMEPLLRNCRGKEDKYVFDIVKRVAPLLELLIDKADEHRFKVNVLIETQRLASSMGLPRLSPATALLEAVFDGFYRAEIIEEQYYEWWAVADDDTPGKMSAMFQVDPFLDWLRNGHYEGDESSESEDKEGEEEEDDDDEDEEDDGSDIEANVPKRAFAGR